MSWADGSNPGNSRASELEAGPGIGDTRLPRLAAEVALISNGRPATLEVDPSIGLLDDHHLAFG